ncbi:sigma factor-like helix-turn-helix DNA-binding protein [Nocardia sp. GAS34]|uniref:sigma factor-like helix-turn-helix DNA-binding protein n=1 Tax=unclassified Nocardia TaxID=2637762 RepID=UPI003D232C7B
MVGYRCLTGVRGRGIRRRRIVVQRRRSTAVSSSEHVQAVRHRAAIILSRLPPRYRTVLELRFLQGRTLRQAAVALGTSVGNATVLQHCALRLAAKLGTGDPAADFTVPEGRRPGPE